MAESLSPAPPRGARRLAVAAARAAGRIQLRHLGLVQEVRYKGEVDLVTEVDVECERVVVDLIRARFPRHRVLAEEGSVLGEDPRYRWIIDPLDGTTNYSHAFPFFCVSIGLEVDGQVVLGVVYDPVRHELFEAERGRGARLNGRPIRASAATALGRSLLATGFPYNRARLSSAMRQFEAMSRRALAVRRMGSAALDLCYVACGRFDAYWELSVSPWDVAAGSLLVLEAGGVVTDATGAPLDLAGGSIIASARGIHASLVEALAQVG